MKLQKKGMIGIGFVVFLAVFFVIVMLAIEIFNIYNYKNYATEEMTRACSISMDLSMLDSARITHNGEIDPDRAKQELSDYLEEILEYTPLDATGMNWGKENEGGNWKYKIEFTEINSRAIPPELSVKGVIKIPPSILGPFLVNWGRSDLCIILFFAA